MDQNDNGLCTPMYELLQLCSFFSAKGEDSGSTSAARKHYYKVVIAGVSKMLEEEGVPKLENP